MKRIILSTHMTIQIFKWYTRVLCDAEPEYPYTLYDLPNLGSMVTPTVIHCSTVQ